MLLTKLLDRQRELSLTDGQMAKRLGCPRTTYSAIKTGKAGISLRMARAIAVAFPDLTDLVLTDSAPDETKKRRAGNAPAEGIA